MSPGIFIGGILGTFCCCCLTGLLFVYCIKRRSSGRTNKTGEFAYLSKRSSCDTDRPEHTEDHSLGSMMRKTPIIKPKDAELNLVEAKGPFKLKLIKLPTPAEP